MFFLSVRRVLRFSWQHFWRNIWLSIITMTIIVLTLFSLTTLIAVNVIADAAVNSIKETVDVSLYFDNQMGEEAILALKNELGKIDEISEIKYISATEALENFKIIHADDADIQETVAELESNPLGATLIVHAYRVEDYPLIMKKIEELKADQLAEQIDYDDHRVLIGKVNNFTDKIRSFNLVLSLIFIFIALLTVYNTIRMGIYVHRKEIGIMRLVGANNWFIRLPFLIEGLFYALFGCILFWIVLMLALQFMGPWINGFLSGINFDIRAYLLGHFFYIFGFELILIAVINTLSAAIAMGRYLRI